MIMEGIADDSGVTITGRYDDVVQVMRTWDVEAPNWTPPYKTRAIAPRKVVAVWVDGRLDRVSVTGPYRLKSGELAQPKFPRDESHIGGTGEPNFRRDWNRMTYCRNLRDFETLPGWLPQFLTDNAPTL